MPHAYAVTQNRICGPIEPHGYYGTVEKAIDDFRRCIEQRHPDYADVSFTVWKRSPGGEWSEVSEGTIEYGQSPARMYPYFD